MLTSYRSILKKYDGIQIFLPIGMCGNLIIIFHAWILWESYFKTNHETTSPGTGILVIISYQSSLLEVDWSNKNDITFQRN